MCCAEMIGPHLSPDDLKRLSDAKEERYRVLLRARGIQLLPGAEQWLCALRAAGWRQALASSAPWLNIEVIINLPALQGRLDAVVSGEDAPHGKPAPDTFLISRRAAEGAAGAVRGSRGFAGGHRGRPAGRHALHRRRPVASEPDRRRESGSLLDLPVDAFETIAGR